MTTTTSSRYNNRYAYRIRPENRSGVRYASKHFRRLEQALTYCIDFLSPTSEMSCTPRRGYPYSSTILVLEERTSDDSWTAICRYEYDGSGRLIPAS